MRQSRSPKYMYRSLKKRLHLGPPSRTVHEDVMAISIDYDPSTDIGKQLYYQGAFERLEIEFCAQLLSRVSDPVVVDVGANIGIHSLCWAVGNDSLRSYLFEPSHATAEVLRRNVMHNSLQSRVVVNELALSSKAGEATFYECSDNAFSSLKDTGRKAVVSETVVTVSTLDEWAQDQAVKRIDLLKIDVEGSERDVVLGGISILRTLRPHLFVEIFAGERSNADPEDTVELIRSLGYHAFVFDKGGSLVPYSSHSDQQYNYYFSPV